jgi:uncharacterized membrane protein
VSLVILTLGYLYAGLNHFMHPSSYLLIIPHYIPYPNVVNLLAGFFEMFFSLMLIFPASRRFAAWGIILMLIDFLPVHVSMILHAPLKLGGITVTPLLAWLRLLILQPLLILWAWWYTSTDNFKSDQ